jgi:voltage-gated potassium channel
MIGGVEWFALIVLAAVVIQLGFARALRRILGDPQLRSFFALVILMLSAGTVFYNQVEGWSILDAFYFSFITLTTVGYGDLAPATAAGKLFTVFYMFAAIGITVGFVISIVKAWVAQRSRVRRSLRRRPNEAERD